MRFTKNSIQNLVDSVSLSEHLKRFIALKHSGSNWLGLCPFHQDSTPSFYVYPKNYHCFACNAHGTLIDYEMHRTGLSFKECVEQLAQMYNQPLERIATTPLSSQSTSKTIDKDGSEILKKIHHLNHTFSAHEKEIINSFYYSSLNLKENLFSNEYRQNHTIFPLYKENGDMYGLIFTNKSYETSFLTLNKSMMPCLNWNEARPFAIKEKQLIVTYEMFDFNLLKQKNINHIVLCPQELNSYLIKQFSKRVKKLILVIPEHMNGKKLLWQTFNTSSIIEDISIDVLLIHSDLNTRKDFFSEIPEEKTRIWLQNADKIHIKIVQLFLDSLNNEQNKLQCFKRQILPIINKIKNISTKNAILADISNKFFYSTNITNHNIKDLNSILHPPLDLTQELTATSNNVVKAQNEKIQPTTHDVDKIKEQALNELMSRVVEYYHKHLLKFKGDAFNYLCERGLNEDEIKRWKIGYCPNSNDLSKKAMSGIIEREHLDILGVIKINKTKERYYDFFYDRIIIPIANHHGEFVALSGRTLNEMKNDKVPKYINSPESEIFSKSKILFNFHKALNAITVNKFVIVVEGYMDCISLANAGIENVVAVMGTALTKYHIDELSKLTKRIVLCFDNDKAGQSAAKRTFAASAYFQNIDLEYLVLPNCKDPDEFIKRFGKEKFLAIAKSKNTLLYEQICEWCLLNSQDNQDFIINIQKEFTCLVEAQNKILTSQVENYIQEKFNFSLKDFFSINSQATSHHRIDNESNNTEIDWPVKNPLEIKLLLSLIYLKFSELPLSLQNILLNLSNIEGDDEKVCAQAIENQFSKTGFQVFIELSSWMLENQHISIAYTGIEIAENFTQETQILIGFALSDVKLLMKFYLHELIKDSLSSGISMVSSQNVWNLKNAGFLKFLLRNIQLASQSGVLPSLFAEALLNLEVDYIDGTLKAHSSLHFDNDLDAQFHFLVTARIRCKTKLGQIGSV